MEEKDSKLFLKLLFFTFNSLYLVILRLFTWETFEIRRMDHTTASTASVTETDP